MKTYFTGTQWKNRKYHCLVSNEIWRIKLQHKKSKTNIPLFLNFHHPVKNSFPSIKAKGPRKNATFPSARACLMCLFVLFVKVLCKMTACFLAHGWSLGQCPNLVSVDPLQKLHDDLACAISFFSVNRFFHFPGNTRCNLGNHLQSHSFLWQIFDL